jgi:hypothetical protein
MISSSDLRGLRSTTCPRPPSLTCPACPAIPPTHTLANTSVRVSGARGTRPSHSRRTQSLCFMQRRRCQTAARAPSHSRHRGGRERNPIESVAHRPTRRRRRRAQFLTAGIENIISHGGGGTAQSPSHHCGDGERRPSHGSASAQSVMLAVANERSSAHGSGGSSGGSARRTSRAVGGGRGFKFACAHRLTCPRQRSRSASWSKRGLVALLTKPQPIIK